MSTFGNSFYSQRSEETLKNGYGRIAIKLNNSTKQKNDLNLALQIVEFNEVSSSDAVHICTEKGRYGNVPEDLVKKFPDLNCINNYEANTRGDEEFLGTVVEINHSRYEPKILLQGLPFMLYSALEKGIDHTIKTESSQFKNGESFEDAKPFWIFTSMFNSRN